MTNQILFDTADDLKAYGHLVSPAAMGKALHGKRFKRYAHINYLSEQLRIALLKGGARIIISMPPRHGKSWLTSLFTPVWYLSHFPRHNVILTSYEAEFAASWGRRVRNEIEANRELLGIQLSSDSASADRWELKGSGGGMITAGIGGSITGRGGHLLLIDDPVKNIEQAMSETYRKKAIEWYQSTFRTRTEPGASIIVIQTRWHENDLAGWLLSDDSGEQFTPIILPAIAEQNDPIGRKLGEALCPERYTVKDLEVIKKGVGSSMWNSLYQQHPSAMEGNFFKRTWWKYYTQAPSRFDMMLQSWDLSFKETKDGSYVVGQCWGKVRADKYLLDQVRVRADFPTTLKLIRSFSAKWPRAHTKLVEDRANGPAVMDALRRELSGLIPVEPDGTKEARAASVAPDVEAGNVWLPDPSIAPWIHDYVEELANFPKAKDDDQVDSTTQALKRFRSSSIPFLPFGVESRYGG